MPAPLTTATAYSPHAFVTDALALLQEHGRSDEGFQAIGNRLRRFAKQPGVVTEALTAAIERAGETSALLTTASDSGLALILTRLSQEAEPLPAGPAWSIACVVQGRVRYLTWKENTRDSSSGPGSRRIARELELNPGDFVYFKEPAHALHGQQAIGGDVWELRLVSLSAAAALDTGSIAYASAA